MKLTLISGSQRQDSNSQRIARYLQKLTRCSTLTSYNVGLLKPVALTFTLFKIGKNTQRVRKQF
nr:hypothetical protein [Xenorhabdus sp. PB61.4]